jgi:signal recognition particle GTPase
MFDSLSSKLEKAFKNLRGLGKISEANAGEALREVRLALLEADVNFKVARDFIERVRTKSIGAEVIQSIQPGQQIIKIIHDELVELLGSANAGLQLSGNPSCVLMVGLHGSGKTTSSAKLGRLLLKQGRTPLLVAADVYRPAAMEQLEKLGQQVQLPVYVHRGATDVLKIAREALDNARANNRNTLIFDTAGRLQIDEPLVQELVRLRDLVKPQEILLVLDAATGQEAVNVATHFDQALNITGSILTKLDGDARGGAALSLKSVTGKPIKFAGVGEKVEDFEPFHPERMTSRILGMGDVVSLVEKARPAGVTGEHVAGRGRSGEEQRHEQIRERISPHGSNDLRHDPAGAADPGDSKRETASAHRQRERRNRDRTQYDAEQVWPDATNDEEDGQVPEDDGEDGRSGWVDGKVNSNFQIPTFRKIPKSKLQSPVAVRDWVLEAWCFSGCWNVEFGISGLIQGAAATFPGSLVPFPTRLVSASPNS